MEILGRMIALMIAIVCTGFLIYPTFLLWSARMAGIESASLGKAFRTTIRGGIASAPLSWILSVVPIVGPIVGFIGGLFIGALIMTDIFSTTFRKAIGAIVLAWVLTLAVGVGIILFRPELVRDPFR